MNYQIECPHCEADTIVKMPNDDPPEHCPVCGEPIDEHNVKEHDGSCLC